ncbi:MAG: SufS family cysteine desulfurase [Patescibacteria group bacterium]
MLINTKKDFRILNRKINGHKLAYLDNAATTQKPQQVIDAVVNYYQKHNSNIHRGIHTLSEESTLLFEEARKKVAGLIGAVVPEEVIFTSGATESLNTASQLVGQILKEESTIVLSELEHHSNLVPWQQLAKQKNCQLIYIPVTKGGLLDYSEAKKILSQKVDALAITHASNVTGEIIKIKDLVKLVKTTNPNCLVVVDGAQAVGHLPVNVQSLGCDFYAFSAHKMLGPTGVGVLWGKRELLKTLEPVKFGGGMITEVYQDHAVWDIVPNKFEAGTPNIAGVIGLGVAVDYLNSYGLEKLRGKVGGNTEYLLEMLGRLGLLLYGNQKAENGVGIVAFNLPGVHSHDLASVLDSVGVAVRSGHHCAMPLHTALDIPSSVRVSLYIYNTKEDIDALISGINKAKKIFGFSGDTPKHHFRGVTRKNS